MGLSFLTMHFFLIFVEYTLAFILIVCICLVHSLLVESRISCSIMFNKLRPPLFLSYNNKVLILTFCRQNLLSLNCDVLNLIALGHQADILLSLFTETTVDKPGKESLIKRDASAFLG